MPLRTEAEVYRGALCPTMDMLFPMADMLLMMMIHFGFIDSNTMLLPGRDNPETIISPIACLVVFPLCTYLFSVSLTITVYNKESLYCSYYIPNPQIVTMLGTSK